MNTFNVNYSGLRNTLEKKAWENVYGDVNVSIRYKSFIETMQERIKKTYPNSLFVTVPSNITVDNSRPSYVINEKTHSL